MDSNIKFNLEIGTDFSDEDCKAYQNMRNEEYPSKLQLTTFENAEKWLRSEDSSSQYLTVSDTSVNPPALIGILFFAIHMDSLGGHWFSMVVRREYQRKGVGKTLTCEKVLRNNK